MQQSRLPAGGVALTTGAVGLEGPELDALEGLVLPACRRQEVHSSAAPCEGILELGSWLWALHNNSSLSARWGTMRHGSLQMLGH